MENARFWFSKKTSHQTEWLNVDSIYWTDNFVLYTQEIVVFLNFITHHIHSQVWKKMMTGCDNNPTLPSYKSLCFSRKIHECLVLCSKSLEWRIFTAHLQGSLWHSWELAQTVQYLYSESIMEGRNVLTWCPSATVIHVLDLQFRHNSQRLTGKRNIDSARPCQSS